MATQPLARPLDNRTYPIMFLNILLASTVFVIVSLITLGHLLNKRRLPASQADVALVFGTGLDWKAKSRWTHAAQLFKQGLVRYIIVSGGVNVPQQSKTEAEWFRENLISLGIPTEYILLENQATNASENASYALSILQNYNFKSVILVMSDFTGLRAHLTAKQAWLGNGIKIYDSHASSSAHWNPWTWWLKQEGRYLTKYVVTRLFRYRLFQYWWKKD